ncbi:hypothetical protein BGX21_000081 [Mortierella sp. AD011]|nr:hypothetical protein BGX20_007843 [Mortierella sp. AD010]KAF9389518.1 hypothetical protein BGX21_000081 [Mortierella sp. AD011]
MTPHTNTSESTSSTPTLGLAATNSDIARQSPPHQQQSSIFLKKKKPTVASVGSKPLLRPFNNKFIDYNNPGKHDLVPLKPTKGTVIPLPGSSPDTPEMTNVFSLDANSSSSSFSSVPFTLDNHTSESMTMNQAKTIAQQDNATSTSAGSPAAGGSTTSGPNNDAFTILRIKRKRYEEPLDTLVVQEQMEKLSGKKQKKIEDSIQQERDNTQAGQVSLPKPPPAVFRLATTVNKESFKDPTQSIQLRDKITHLAENRRPRSRMSERIQDLESFAQKNRAELTERMQKDARSARFRVINQNRGGMATSDRPPQVKSSVEAEAEAALDVFKMYDAVREDEPKSEKQPSVTNAEESDIMCNFLPMVREYLSISEKTPEPRIISTSESGEGSTTPLPRTRRNFDDDSDFDDSEDEYVYDIYYRDLHADHQQESKHRAIGALLWFSDDENNFMNEDDSSDDDFEDSDSNAEDYYQNDYPEDELSDNDYNPYDLSDTDDDDYLY